jgi:hypothetical protein
MNRSFADWPTCLVWPTRGTHNEVRQSQQQTKNQGVYRTSHGRSKFRSVKSGTLK